MRVWWFSEQSYHPGWDKVDGSLRLLPPSEIVDPQLTNAILHERFDEWCAADEMGLDIMVNEHHSSLACFSVSPMLTLAALARQTKKARLLCLGVLLANRPDPLRVAEEIAYVDNLSGGRLDIGLVKGSPWELYASNNNPAGMMDRYWEAYDLVLKAWQTKSGPFSWEGRHFHYRSVNVLPPIYQYPHPPMWMPCSTEATATVAAQRDCVQVSFLDGYVAKDTFGYYKRAYQAAHGREPGEKKLAYAGMAVVGNSEAEARERALRGMAFYKTVSRSVPATRSPPGYNSVEVAANALLAGHSHKHAYGKENRKLPKNPSLEQLAEAGVVFWGTPDQVYRQIEKFYRAVGGFEHFLCLGQAGYMEHAETMDSLRLMAKEVYPRLRDLALPTMAEAV